MTVGVLRVADMAAIVPLYAGWPENLARAALESGRGMAWANESHTAAQVVSGDFAFLAGDAACADAPALAGHVPQGFAADTLIVAAREPKWLPLVETAFGDCATKAERFAIRKDVHHFDRERLHALAATLPPGVELRFIDAALYHAALAQGWSRDFVSQFADEADYLARGLGVMALLNGDLLAGASSYVTFQGGVEVEIDTRADMRRQGLATACGAAMVLACLERGLYPSWDAANRASVALAEKLGYVADHPYTVYHIAVNR